MKRKTALLLLLICLAGLTVSCRQGERREAAPPAQPAPASEKSPEQTDAPGVMANSPAEAVEPADDALVRV